MRLATAAPELASRLAGAMVDWARNGRMKEVVQRQRQTDRKKKKKKKKKKKHGCPATPERSQRVALCTCARRLRRSQ